MRRSASGGCSACGEWTGQSQGVCAHALRHRPACDKGSLCRLPRRGSVVAVMRPRVAALLSAPNPSPDCSSPPCRALTVRRPTPALTVRPNPRSYVPSASVSDPAALARARELVDSEESLLAFLRDPDTALACERCGVDPAQLRPKEDDDFRLDPQRGTTVPAATRRRRREHYDARRVEQLALVLTTMHAMPASADEVEGRKQVRRWGRGGEVVGGTARWLRPCAHGLSSRACVGAWRARGRGAALANEGADALEPACRSFREPNLLAVAPPCSRRRRCRCLHQTMPAPPRRPQAALRRALERALAAEQARAQQVATAQRKRKEVLERENRLIEQRRAEWEARERERMQRYDQIDRARDQRREEARRRAEERAAAIAAAQNEKERLDREAREVRVVCVCVCV